MGGLERLLWLYVWYLAVLFAVGMVLMLVYLVADRVVTWLKRRGRGPRS